MTKKQEIMTRERAFDVLVWCVVYIINTRFTRPGHDQLKKAAIELERYLDKLK